MSLDQLIRQYGLKQLKKSNVYFVEHQYDDKTYSDCFIYQHQALQTAQKKWRKLAEEQKHLHQITVWRAKITGNQQHINGEDLFEVEYEEELLKLK